MMRFYTPRVGETEQLSGGTERSEETPGQLQQGGHTGAVGQPVQQLLLVGVDHAGQLHALAGDVLVADLGTDGATANTFHHLAGHEDLHTVRVSKS